MLTSQLQIYTAQQNIFKWEKYSKYCKRKLRRKTTGKLKSVTSNTWVSYSP